eukprot:GHVT01032694.1.p1 GENE.GHVT01032694.1~~GHVT01032694.1.p1  ORF type:complete len:147 (-),score=17.38 GHVT01032694.1:1189-1629(-)
MCDTIKYLILRIPVPSEPIESGKSGETIKSTHHRNGTRNGVESKNAMGKKVAHSSTGSRLSNGGFPTGASFRPASSLKPRCVQLGKLQETATVQATSGHEERSRPPVILLALVLLLLLEGNALACRIVRILWCQLLHLDKTLAGQP